MCRVLQKQSLLLHRNWLASLKGGGIMKDLCTVRILDLHDNEFITLPDDIDQLCSLQVLNLENNKLKALPDTIGNLTSLQSLNCRKNKIRSLPVSLCELPSLRTLDISENPITCLPKELCHIRTLESLTVPENEMIYPPYDICKQGTEAVMKFLCQESGEEYQPPSKFLLNILDPPNPITSSSSVHSFKAIQQDNMIDESVLQYESLKEKKRLAFIALERQIEEDQLAQAQLAVNAAQQKGHILNAIGESQNQLESELNQLQQQKEENRKVLVAHLYEVDKNATNLVKQLLEMNEKWQKREALLEQMERERMEAEEWFKVHQEEAESLRRKEVLINMDKILSESEAFESVRQEYQKTRDSAARRAQESYSEVDGVLSGVLQDKQIDQNELMKYLMQQERLQMDAFQALQLQKDAKHMRISTQIEMIEQELSQLTLLEVERREMKLDIEKNVLYEKRKQLSDLLMQLLTEKEQRERELHKRLQEMEDQRVDDQKDYWLIQYQRLMDRKPQALMDDEKKLEIAVVKILEQSNAGEYIPKFARHRITIETLYQLTDDDLKQIGVHEVGLRKSILQHIQDDRAKQNKEDKLNNLDFDKLEGATGGSPPPTAPPEERRAISRQMSEITARITPECCVCMENESSMVFLPCGHVCCCENCSTEIEECPLCRTPVVQRVILVKSDS